jgi:hypothetical protein
MTQQDPNKHDLLPDSKDDKVLDIAAIFASAAPWIGGPVSAVVSGMSIKRKFDRVREVLEGLASDLRDFKSQASENYVKTDEFQELLENALLKAADERNETKRAMYRLFLTDIVRSPGSPYDEQIRFLRTLGELQSDHLRIIKAISEQPDIRDGFSGSPSATLKERLPDMDATRIADLVAQLNDMRITKLISLNTMMTFRGAQDLRNTITPYGQRLLTYILSKS